MSKFRKLLDSALLVPDQKTIMFELAKILDDVLLDLEVAHPHYYWKVIHKLHMLINGPHFDEAMAVWAVSQMINEDGTKGAHWTIEDTSSVAASTAIVFDKFNKWDWYYVLNMIYSDYYNVIGSDISLYVQFSKAWIADKDAPEGKAFKYFMAMCDK